MALPRTFAFLVLFAKGAAHPLSEGHILPLHMLMTQSGYSPVLLVRPLSGEFAYHCKIHLMAFLKSLIPLRQFYWWAFYYNFSVLIMSIF